MLKSPDRLFWYSLAKNIKYISYSHQKAFNSDKSDNRSIKYELRIFSFLKVTRKKRPIF